MFAAFALLAVTLVAAEAPSVKAQTLQSEKSKNDWQTEAGGRMAFDVASVKQNTCGLPPTCVINSNLSLQPGEAFTPTGGLFTETNWYLMPLIVFAYKLDANSYKLLEAQLPKWALTERFDIQARASGNPTKDQYRLMMQSLLADRFKLEVHTENRQLPVFALVLEKPGKLGPMLRQHLDDPPCAPAETQSPLVPGEFPVICGVNLGRIASGRRYLGARNVTLELIGGWLSAAGQLGRPVVNRTGLHGVFDFVVEWVPEFNGPPPPGFQPDESGPTLFEALKDQLGLKVIAETGSVNVLTIDHVGQPSGN